ncbi:MAG: UvrD-helicase domain-containing protein [Mycoplasmataceae bacterium]|nr:UvrD-helicase domain-containing protein [Mycoplasmataceae bacterium]
MKANELIDELNKEQKAAVLHNKGPLAIIAGAGTGKTRTITRKIAYLIKNKKMTPENILAVTFSNKAANEMRERVFNLVGEQANLAQISTYHAFCVKVLREEIAFFDYPRKFNILDDIDQKQILRPIYKKFGISPHTFSYKETTSFISKMKMTKKSPEEVLESASNDNERIKAKLYLGYVAETKRIKSLDFDDLLIFVHTLFNKDAKIAKKWADKYKYVLVDEFQDTSLIQYEIIKAIVPHNNITIVGDPDQTIYTWRQADVSIINNFKKYFKGASVIKLVENYRSTETILEAANKLISHNKNRIKKDLFSNLGKGNIIEFYHGFSDDAEARWVTQKIKELKKEKNQLKEIAILYRANYISQPFEKNLINEGINYNIFGGLKFYQRKEIKDAIAYLKLINNGDEVSLRRMINIPSRKIGAVALSKLVGFAGEKGQDLYRTIINDFNEIPLSATQSDSLATFLNLITKYKRAMKSNSIALVMEKFLLEVNYRSIWKISEDQDRFNNLDQLVASIKEWEKDNSGKTLNDYLEEVSLYIDTDTEKSKDYISLQTIHSAKGLEFKNVFIVGFSEGVFPSTRAMDESGDAGLEEERRLAYVAVTRAKERVFISNSRGYAIDHKTQKKPSRFISELGVDIKDFTSEFIAPMNFDDNYEKNKKVVVGDKVSHLKFGIGVIVKVAGDLIDISFKDPHGVKTLMKNHKSIERIK